MYCEEKVCSRKVTGSASTGAIFFQPRLFERHLSEVSEPQLNPMPFWSMRLPR